MFTGFFILVNFVISPFFPVFDHPFDTQMTPGMTLRFFSKTRVPYALRWYLQLIKNSIYWQLLTIHHGVAHEPLSDCLARSAPCTKNFFKTFFSTLYRFWVYAPSKYGWSMPYPTPGTPLVHPSILSPFNLLAYELL